MRVAVIVPRSHVVGGVRRAAWGIVDSLGEGSHHWGDDVEIVLAVAGGLDPWQIDAPTRTHPGRPVEIRAIEFISVAEDSVQTLMHAVGREIPAEAGAGPWAMAVDGMHDLLDCDAWFVISSRVLLQGRITPLLPLRPTALVPFDFLEAYGYTGMPELDVQSSLRFARACDAILVSTNHTGRDAVSLAGCRRDRVVLTPIEFEPHPRLSQSGDPADRPPHALWITNASPHKNHARTLAALDDVARRYPDFSCVVVGYGVRDAFASLQSGESRSYLDIRDFVPDSTLADLLSGARLLLHSAVMDNGSFTPVDAAVAGVTSVCADYPPMREIAERFGLPCLWFDPWQPEDIARAVAEGWTHPGRPAVPPALVFAEGTTEGQEGRQSNAAFATQWYGTVRTWLVPGAA